MDARITLVDISPKSLAFARRHFEGLGLRARYAIQDGLNLGFRDGSFDVVWNGGVIEHFTDEGKVALIREMYRITRPGGLLLIVVPNALDLPFRLGKWIAERRGKWIFGYEDDLSEGRFRRLAERGCLRSKFLLTKITTITINDVQGSPTLFLDRLNFAGGEVFLVKANVKIINQFLKRTARLKDKLDLIRIVISPVTFGQITGERNRCPSDLTRQLKSFKVRQPPAHSVHRLSELARYLIGLQILKGMEASRLRWPSSILSVGTSVTSSLCV